MLCAGPLPASGARPACKNLAKRPMQVAAIRVNAVAAPERMLRDPREENAPGDFYVDSTCIGKSLHQLVRLSCAHSSIPNASSLNKLLLEVSVLRWSGLLSCSCRLRHLSLDGTRDVHLHQSAVSGPFATTNSRDAKDPCRQCLHALRKHFLTASLVHTCACCSQEINDVTIRRPVLCSCLHA